MKTKLVLTPLLLLLFSSVWAYNQLRISDPLNWWSNQGTIDSATLSIKPKGAFFECGLYLEFSLGSYNSYNDTTEVVMDFELPEGAFITDSWLWVGNQIVKADLMDRGRATMIYEGIVKRRQDPSLLVKNSSTQYQIRVFPLPPGQSRKVKITYMMPAEWASGQVSMDIPTALLKTSASLPSLRVIVYEDSVWKSPAMFGSSSIFLYNTSDSKVATITPNVLSNNVGASLSVVYPSPMQNGLFAATYETASGEGYYQLVMQPRTSLNLTQSRKVVMLIEHRTSETLITPYELYNDLQSSLKLNFTAIDSFNVIVSGNTNNIVSSVWLPCDSVHISQAFSQLPASPNIAMSKLEALLLDGVDFIQNNGGSGEILLVSSSHTYTNVNASNNSINTVLTKMNGALFPIHCLDYSTIYNQNNWFNTNTQSYYGNEYFYKTISGITNGYYSICRDQYYYYYNYFKPVKEVAADLFNKSDLKVSFLNLTPNFQSGFTFAAYKSTQNAVSYNSYYTEIGRFIGSTLTDIDVTGFIAGVPTVTNLPISQQIPADSFTRKMWVSAFLDDFQFGNLDNVGKALVVDSSRSASVLSMYTAFLALEPSDTTQACSDCEDETNPNNPVSVASLESDNLLVSISPNPFSQHLSITIQLGTAIIKDIKIYDLMGRLVKSFVWEANSNELTLSWDGNDDAGQLVSVGVYILIVKTDSGSKALRVIRQ